MGYTTGPPKTEKEPDDTSDPSLVDTKKSHMLPAKPHYLHWEKHAILLYSESLILFNTKDEQ